MWFGDGNTVWHKETHNSKITWVPMNKINAHGEDFWLFFSLSFFHMFYSDSVCLSSVFLVLFSCELQPVGGEQFGLLGCLCSLSVSQQAHTGERLLCRLAASQMPRGPDRLLNLSS